MAERIGPVEGIEYLDRKELLESPPTRAAAGRPVRRRPRGHRRAAVHERHHGRAESGRAAPPQPGVVHPLDCRVRGSGRGRGGAGQRAAVPHRRRVPVLSSTYRGRRVYYMESFDPDAWVARCGTRASPTPWWSPPCSTASSTWSRRTAGGLPTLRACRTAAGPCRWPSSSGPCGSCRMPVSSTPTGSPRRRAPSPCSARRTTGRPSPVTTRPSGAAWPRWAARCPTLEVTIRGAGRRGATQGERGEIWVRGEQVSGEYLGRGGGPDDGWFNTRDAGHLDEAGLPVRPRPARRCDRPRRGEPVSRRDRERPDRAPRRGTAAVVGIPDTDWGEKVVAAIMLRPGASVSEAELQDFVRARLRSTRTPEHIRSATSCRSTRRASSSGGCCATSCRPSTAPTHPRPRPPTAPGSRARTGGGHPGRPFSPT